MKRIASLIIILLTLASVYAQQTITVTRCRGWFETATLKWKAVKDASWYQVSYSGEGVSGVADDMLIRTYSDHIRCDIPGLKAGDYTFVISAFDKKGESIAESYEVACKVQAFTREGWAFAGENGDARTTYSPGAYNMDGTPKEDAAIYYLTADNANTLTGTVIIDSKGKKNTFTGICNILTAYGRGYDSTPVIIRVIGQVKQSDIEGLKDNNFLSFTGSNNTTRLFPNVTIEGIGDDATLYGYGITCKRTKGVECRNLGIMLFGDDGFSMDTDNSNIWIHHNDFYYGAPGSDADQVKGDGSIDMKYNSTNVTVAYNHFFDSGKVMGCGGSKETVPTYYLTVHHNWFDHCDSRCPRLHYATAHVYNNYYDGVSVYGMGNTTETSAFMEGNYFRNCPRPMMISGQGTDKWDGASGTFSGQSGGMTKAFSNYIAGAQRIVYQDEYPTDFDAYLVDSRDEEIPSSVVSKNGGWAYSNFDTKETMYSAKVEEPEDAMTSCTTYAGRMDGGDLPWTFDNATEDENHDVIPELKEAILNYQCSLVSIQQEGSSGGNTDPDPDPSGIIKGGYIIDLINDGNSGFTITGTTSSDKGTVTIDGNEYAECLNMDSSADITFTITEPMLMTLCFNGSAGNRIIVTNLDEITIPDDNMVERTLPTAGVYTIVRSSGESYLYYIALTPLGSAVGSPGESIPASKDAPAYNLAGQRVGAAGRGLVVRKGIKQFNR